MALAVFKGSDKRILQVIIEEEPRTYAELRLRMTKQKPFFADSAVNIGLNALSNRKQIFIEDSKYYATELGKSIYQKHIEKIK